MVGGIGGRALLIVAVVVLTGKAWAQAAVCHPPSTADADALVDKLIDAMTVDEQVLQMQDRAPAIPRLGLPAYNWWNEGLHGLARNGYATVFPQAIGLAATFDTELLHAVGETVSTEARAKRSGLGNGDSPRYGGLTVWSPNINIFRDPRWGRGQETYGEDPFLTASLGLAFVHGVQGDDPFFLRADATPKHFVAHSGPEEGRDSFNAVVSPHDLEDTYEQAFHLLLGQGHAAAMMCSYNAINGVPSCANRGLLEDTVRQRWGFTGYVVSDCDAVGNITEYHHFTADRAHGAAAALKAGTDLDCGTSYAPLKEALARGLVTRADIHQALHRLMLARLKLGALTESECSPYAAIPAAANDSAEHRALALRAAEESVVLLKNDGVLPLRRSGQKIAVIGAPADMMKVLEANYHGTAAHPITPREGLADRFAATYAQGSLLADGMAALVPPTALRAGSTAADEAGLQAEYFPAASFDAAPVAKRIVSKVDLDLNRAGPLPEAQAKQFAIRWSGSFVPPAAGDYMLRVSIERCWDCTTHDRFQLLLDGKVVIENDGSKLEPNQFALHAADMNPHALQLELQHTGEDEGIALEWVPPASALLDEAVAAAKKADVIVAFAGLSPDLEGEAMPVHVPGFLGGDRLTLDLPEAQRTLLARLRALHKPMVLVLTSGSAVALSAEEQQANAILEAWYPGEAGGLALAKILAGSVNPSGRLPVTFYRSADDLPAFSDYRMEHRTYRYFDGPVLYPFGYGLSYTKFIYGPVRVAAPSVKAGDVVTVTTVIKNAGGRDGDEVAELYLAPPQASGMPRLTLQGVQRVSLKPGESQTLTFTLQDKQLSFVDASGVRAVRAGTYRVTVGGGQPAVGEHGAEFAITGERVQP